MKTLVAYFSRAGQNHTPNGLQFLEKGNTEIVAEIIAKHTGCDVFKIDMITPYSEDYKECVGQAVADWKGGVRPVIHEFTLDINKYDTIYVGYPNYCGTMPMPVWTFLESQDLKDKHIYPFCTHEGSGPANSMQDLKTLCPNSIIEEPFDLKGSTVKESEDKIVAWLNK